MLCSAKPISIDDSVEKTNRESCSGNLWSPTGMPESPAVTGILRVKGYWKMGL